MKIVNILGGLGNQMFEYAMYLALKNAHPEEDVYCCTRSFRGYDLHNGYELKKVFGINAPEASLWQLVQLAYPFINYKTWQVVRHLLPNRKTMTFGFSGSPYNKEIITCNKSIYYDGYWQNENNFKHIRKIILKEFSFPPFRDSNNCELSKRLASTTSVSCHIRRGDYLKEPMMCVCTPDYYERAIKKMNELVAPKLYCVFSDDIGWCKEYLPSLLGKDIDIVYVDWNKGENSYRDMQLMTLCNHNIIANSSFSWWGAWLNNNPSKRVIAPTKWMAKDIKNNPICRNWIRL